jgi:Spy/CpxP family protein refolding chaperone
METMKARLLGVLTLAGVVGLSPTVRAAESSATAQPAQNERRAAIRGRMQAVAKELGLTDEQKQKLKPIIQGQWEKMRALRDDQSLARPAKFEKFKALREEMAAQMKGVLTPDQLAKWQNIRQERRGQATASASQP